MKKVRILLLVLGWFLVIPAAKSQDLSTQQTLLVAANLGNLELAKVALADGADINALVPTSEDFPLGIEPGAAALHLATAAGFGDMANFLLNRGANPNG